MADGPALALQASLVSALKADAGVAALVADRVYDEPPQAVVFPYVRIGEIIARQADTDKTYGFEIAFGIEAYSRPNSGRVEAARIAAAVQAALHDKTLTVTGYNNAWTFFETMSASRGSDGREYSSVVAFTAQIDAA